MNRNELEQTMDMIAEYTRIGSVSKVLELVGELLSSASTVEPTQVIQSNVIDTTELELLSKLSYQDRVALKRVHPERYAQLVEMELGGNR